MKKMKRMMDGGMADMRRPGTMVQPGVPSGPRRGGRPFDPKPFPPIVSPGPGNRPIGPPETKPVRPIIPPDPGDIRPINPPETKPVRPRVPPGPKIGVRPADPKPANPRVTYGPRTTPVDVTGMPVGGPKTGVMPTRRAMRGGGLARKGVGMALAKGGLARRAGGCAKRGVGRGKIM